MSTYITTHNASGQAVFSSTVPEKNHKIDLGGCWDMQILYTNHGLPANLSTEADITQYAKDRENGLETGGLAPPNGTMALIVTLHANAETPLHRSMTLDTCVVHEGVVEMHLDSGEYRTLYPGDCFVQRGSIHSFKNITPNGGVMKFIAFAQPIVAPLEVGGKKLETDFPPF